MPINFIPNDPRVAGLPLRQVDPLPDRPAGRVGLSIASLPPPGLYPATDIQFLPWQARQAALTALATFEGVFGPLPGWQGDASNRTLQLLPDAGDDLNAYYNRQSLSFFHTDVGGSNFLTGVSSDTVSHECGHAILDSLRPDLWNSQMIEISSFHEGFGDCVAMLTALSDQATRQFILAGDPGLANANAVETLIEDLAAAIATKVPGHNAALPRRGLNDFQWVLPTTLPFTGPPGALINEVHSFGQLLAGTFYRTILGIYRTGAPGEATLWGATRVAAWLLAGAIVRAPLRPRFMQSVGRTMLALDQAQYQGANAPAIRAAYGHHGIDLAGGTPFAPSMTLDGGTAAKPLGTAGAATLRQVLGATADAPVTTRTIDIAGTRLTQASVSRAVDLSSLDVRLAGVVAPTPHVATIGRVNGMAAMLGSTDSPVAVDAEVRDYVANLLRRGSIAFAAPASKGGATGSGAVGLEGAITHRVVSRRGVKTLERAAFACGCRALCGHAPAKTPPFAARPAAAPGRGK